MGSQFPTPTTTMGLRDLLGVRKPKAEQPGASSAAAETLLSDEVPAPSAATETLVDTEPISEGGFGAPAEMLGKDLPKVMPGGGYNPYSGLGGPFDQNMSKAIYSLSDTPEFLFDEERSMHRRSWSENLTFLTGVGYLGGIIAGGGLGIYTGLQVRQAPHASVANNAPPSVAISSDLTNLQGTALSIYTSVVFFNVYWNTTLLACA